MDTAISLGKPFLVVPCCVFPTLFSERVDPATGEPVVTHQQFVDYLRQKRYPTTTGAGGATGAEGAAGEVGHVYLPFVGRNQGVYGVPAGMRKQ